MTGNNASRALKGLARRAVGGRRRRGSTPREDAELRSSTRAPTPSPLFSLSLSDSLSLTPPPYARATPPPAAPPTPATAPRSSSPRPPRSPPRRVATTKSDGARRRRRRDRTDDASNLRRGERVRAEPLRRGDVRVGEASKSARAVSRERKRAAARRGAGERPRRISRRRRHARFEHGGSRAGCRGVAFGGASSLRLRPRRRFRGAPALLRRLQRRASLSQTVFRVAHAPSSRVQRLGQRRLEFERRCCQRRGRRRLRCDGSPRLLRRETRDVAGFRRRRTRSGRDSPPRTPPGKTRARRRRRPRPRPSRGRDQG